MTSPELQPLAPRPPRPLVVHWLVDSAIVFLLVVLVALFLGAPLWAVALAALVIGAPLAPWTRRAEARALARRDLPDASAGEVG